MKIGLIGFGYWGKIVFNNLTKLGYDNIVVCDKVDVINQNLTKKVAYVSDYKKMKCDKVFVVTPTDTHYDIVKYFLSKGVDVFCEKPLTMDEKTSSELYKIAEENNAKLFVDWIFTFNNEIFKLKKLIQYNGLNIKNVILNRLNFGPERFDVNAVMDLASHDVSILCYLFDQEPENVDWLNFKRGNNSIQNDSTVGVLKYKNFTVQINASWYYGEKYRKSFFEFDGGFIYWDDKEQKLESSFTLEKDYMMVGKSPLETSITNFITDNYNQLDQKYLTLRVQKIIEKGNDSKI